METKPREDQSKYVTATGRLESEQRAYGTETDSEESTEDSTAEQNLTYNHPQRPQFTMRKYWHKRYLCYTLGLPP